MPQYIRFLKPPRSAAAGAETKAGKPVLVTALVTIVSDLGDTFYAHPTTLRADLRQQHGPRGASVGLGSSSLCTARIPWAGGGARTAKVEMKFLVPHTRLYDAGGKTQLKYVLEVCLETTTKKNQQQQPRMVDNLLDYQAGFGVGIVPAYSAPFGLAGGSEGFSEAFVERRFMLARDCELRIWEETGESIARHIWGGVSHRDGGVALTAYLAQHESSNSSSTSSSGLTSTASAPPPPLPPLSLLHKKLQQHHPYHNPLAILELGSGCGIVGIALSLILQCRPGKRNSRIVLTDLPSAEEVATRNIEANCIVRGGGERQQQQQEEGELEGQEEGKAETVFRVYDWDDPLPPQNVFDQDINGGENENPHHMHKNNNSIRKPDIILVADCTYNPDSAAALVKTLRRCCLPTGAGGNTHSRDFGLSGDTDTNTETVVVLAHKKRHESETLFFELMAQAGFVVVDQYGFSTKAKSGSLAQPGVRVGGTAGTRSGVARRGRVVQEDSVGEEVEEEEVEVVDLYTFRLGGGDV
ncbi:putative methyltransferase-domain-containing protein [Peziza echinospora]|nr:putative methyltransferase-domain-containing protein [Peziza echinospora]